MTSRIDLEALAVFSGEVCLCPAGLETGVRDMKGEPLFSGDIVAIFTEVRGEVPDYEPILSAVIVENGEPFVMGIKSIPLDEPGIWRVWRLKSAADVVPGERWKEWGFHYEVRP